MGEAHRLSVVAAAYNVQKEIGLLLESLWNSEFKDFEVCICDDQSQDDTLKVIRSYAGRLDIRLTVNEVNRGVTYSRNQASRLAQSPLLLFLDADVRIYPDTMTRLLETQERTQADVVEGIYSPVALDGGVFSRYYALFVHHSFLISQQPVEYNVFNGWCALCRREVIAQTGGHEVIEKGMEIENEALGRRIVASGFTLLLDPSVFVDHHWGGYRKLVFIFTRRVYWWVKIFFSTGCHFEAALTTPSYALSTLCIPLAVVAGALAGRNPIGWTISVLFLLFFLAGYGPFYKFVLKRQGVAYSCLAALLSMYFAFLAVGSAAYSGIEEIVKKILLGNFTLDPELFQA